MKRISTLKRGNGFKKVVGNSFKNPPLCLKHHNIALKKSSFKISDLSKEIRETDSKFSKYVIKRDGKCLHCGSTEMLTCSHFHGRANYATRFEPMNCVCFCINCHTILESKKSTIYMDWMIGYLGEEQFFVLDKISKMKITRQDSLILAHNLLKKVETNSDIQY